MMARLIRTEPENNMDRWYFVGVQPTLLDPWAVVCAWGNRRTRYMRVRLLPAESLKVAKEIAAGIVAQKVRRGYFITAGGEETSPATDTIYRVLLLNFTAIDKWGQADAIFQQQLIFGRFQPARRQPDLIQSLPELIALASEIAFPLGRYRARGRAAEDDEQIVVKQVGQHIIILSNDFGFSCNTGKPALVGANS
jgi:predicted DNA-binding WGR domain protein